MGEVNVEQHIIADKTAYQNSTGYIMDTDPVLYPLFSLFGSFPVFLPAYYAFTIQANCIGNRILFHHTDAYHHHFPVS